MIDNNEHIIRTTSQWKERAVQYKIIPRGCLCIELTPDNKTKIKIGEGNKYYEQLPYITSDASVPIETIIKLIHDMLNEHDFLEIMGTYVDDVSQLPMTGNKDGDFRFVKKRNPGEHDKYDEYVWFNNMWEKVNSDSDDIDLSEYAKITYVDESIGNVNTEISYIDSRLEEVELLKHTHANKTVIDQLTQADIDKLRDLTPYTLLPATTETLGGVIIGDGLSVETDGTISIDSIDPSMLPIATTESLGIISIGDNLDIDEHGVLSAPDPYELPVASTTVLGGIKVGENLEMDVNNKLNGMRYVPGEGMTIQYRTYEYVQAYHFTEEITAGVRAYMGVPYRKWVKQTTGECIACLLAYNMSGGISATYYYACPLFMSTNMIDVYYYHVDCNDSWTPTSAPSDLYTDVGHFVDDNGQTWYYSLCQDPVNTTAPVDSFNNLTTFYRPGDSGMTESIARAFLAAAITGFYKYEGTVSNTGVLDVTGDASTLTITKATGTSTINIGGGYVLPKATTTSLGGIIVGNNLSIDNDGVLSANAGQYTLPIASDTTLGGIKIGDNLTIDENGVLSADLSGIEYHEGAGIDIYYESGGGSDYDTDSEFYYVSTGAQSVATIDGRSFSITAEQAPMPKYGALFRITTGYEYTGPMLISKSADAVRLVTSYHGNTNEPIAFQYNGETWYRSDNGFWMEHPSSISTPLQTHYVDTVDLTTEAYNFLDEIQSGVGRTTYIKNTGVLNVSKTGTQSLSIEKADATTTISLDTPISTTTTLGSVIVGSNLSVDANGVVSVDTTSGSLANTLTSLQNQIDTLSGQVEALTTGVVTIQNVLEEPSSP